MSLAVIGATSEIAQSTAKVFLDAGHDLLLVARDIDKLEKINLGVLAGGRRIDKLKGDITQPSSVNLITERVIECLGKDPYVLVAVGSIENSYSCCRETVASW